jgi:hypothetical protein
MKFEEFFDENDNIEFKEKLEYLEDISMDIKDDGIWDIKGQIEFYNNMKKSIIVRITTHLNYVDILSDNNLISYIENSVSYMKTPYTIQLTYIESGLYDSRIFNQSVLKNTTPIEDLISHIKLITIVAKRQIYNPTIVLTFSPEKKKKKNK